CSPYSLLCFFRLPVPSPPRSTLFPYTTLFRSPFMTTVLSTQMFPGVLFLLPLYLIFVNIDTTFGVPLVGTRIDLIITYLTFSLRSEEHTSELQSRFDLVCRLLLEQKKTCSNPR